jgi:PTH1 family peptidyl-tRNA hydrolase
MDPVFLIAGLGNPGREYEGTRHNAGFMVVERLARRWNAEWGLERKFQARAARVRQEQRQSILCLPQTFMNSSGEAVGALRDFYRVPNERVLVIVDDADLPLGELRLRPSGRSGGHHGLESVEQHLGTQDYARLRVGIGRTDASVREITGHVLGDFRADEREPLEKVLTRACEQVECWLAHGPVQAMNRFNGPVKP